MKRISQGCWLGIVLMAALVVGCTAPQAQLNICPGKASVDEALAALDARVQRAQPLRVNGGQCRFVYYEPGDEEPTRHNLSPRLWFNPPSQIYVQLSVGVDQKAVVIGCNDESFWMGLRPQEVSSYYWGTWDQAQEVDGLMVGPKVVLEAFGIIQRDGANDSGTWSLSNEGPYDILTKRDASGQLVKRVHIYACDYLVHMIEYFDTQGKSLAVAELGDYVAVAEGFDVPTEISVRALNLDGKADEMSIKLYDPKVKALTARAQEVYFNRNLRDMDKYDHVYRYEEGQWVTER